MPPSSLEVAMQTVGSFLSDYMKEKKNVSVITKDGLKQLVKEQFPHCEKKEIRPGVYEIGIPLEKRGAAASQDFTDFQEENVEVEFFEFVILTLRVDDAPFEIIRNLLDKKKLSFSALLRLSKACLIILRISIVCGND
ncbi:UNVERIFIED_CONTAM: hypothetical protein K2H54_021458 [Gekko kuhli]